jgi:glycosyltransferase involved in cell wall biosynthesis
LTRALIIEPAGNLWGSEQILLEFITRMPNIQVAVCCPPKVPLIAELEKLSVRVFPYFIYALHEKSKLKRFWASVGVMRACYQFRPDVIFLNQGGCYQVTLLASVLFDLPIVAHIQIYEDVTYFCERHPSPRRLRGLVCISSSIAQEFRGCHRLSAVPQHLLYHSYVSRADQSLQSKVDNRVACVGRVVPVKGQDLLIRAIKRLVDDGEKIDCVMVGDGPGHFVRELKQVAGTGAAASHIHWLGYRADVVSVLANCVVVACPSHREPLGRVIFEAWDAGAVPVACEKSGGAAEIIAAADGGILYAEQTPECLAQAILAAVRLPQEAVSRLIRNGRQWMSKHCDPTRHGATLAKILSDAAMATHRK